MAKISFPQYRKGRNGIELFEGTILDHAHELGIEIPGECGGLGKCGSCLVRIERGAECLNEKTNAERLQDLGPDERLACQARVVEPVGHLMVFVEEPGRYTIVTETMDGAEISVEPSVTRRDGQVVHASGATLGPAGDHIYGLALDVGTTTLAFQVLDLEDGHVVATAARTNPQIAYGNDIISRIGHTMHHEGGLRALQRTVVNGVNEELEALEADHPGLSSSIYDVVVVGNSTMRDIFFGRDVTSLGIVPFEPLDTGPVEAPAEELGLAVNPAARVYGGALIGGHGGADAVADVVASRMWKGDDVSMVIDIGTNGEVVIGNRDRMMSASCAAGGAYEGATVSSGVGAVEGAITDIRLADGRVEYETLGDRKPVGICGSGLIDLLAELLRTGRMSREAKIGEDYCLVDGICITQQDVYELITAKAGLRLDQDLLMKYYGVELEEIEHIFLAGGFGNYIDPANAVAIGLLPPAPEKVVRMGNGALAGAREMLISRSIRTESERVARMIEHTKPNELEPEFPYLVADKMYF